MKTIYSVLLFIAISFNSFSQGLMKSKTENSKPFIVSLYPLAFFSSNFMVGFEHGITNKISGRINTSIGYSDKLSYYEFNNNSQSVSNQEMLNQSAFYLEGQLRYYPGESVTNGIYLAPYLLYKTLNFDLKEGTYTNQGALVEVTSHKKMNAVAGGILVGYQYQVFEILSIDAYLGGGPMVPQGDYGVFSFAGFDPWKRGMVAMLGLNVGVKIK